MVDQGIARAIANIAIFLEFSSDAVINEDASVEAMEQLAADLQSLNERERANLAASLKALAPSYGGDYSDFVLSLPDSFGLE
ncbi:MAG: hypothetical protein J0M19_11945 [Sphingomonadales bacterium]|nr:hypothetical protein [Sphingomonadales bacterium]